MRDSRISEVDWIRLDAAKSDFDQRKKRHNNITAKTLEVANCFDAKSKTTRIETRYREIACSSTLGFDAKSKTTRIETADTAADHAADTAGFDAKSKTTRIETLEVPIGSLAAVLLRCQIQNNKD